MTSALSAQFRGDMRLLADSGTAASDATLLVKLLAVRRLLVLSDTASGLAGNEPEATALLGRASNAQILNGTAEYGSELRRRERELTRQAQSRQLLVLDQVDDVHLKDAITASRMSVFDEISQEVAVHSHTRSSLNRAGSTSSENNRLRAALKKSKEKIIRKLDIFCRMGGTQVRPEVLLDPEQAEQALAQLFPSPSDGQAAASSSGLLASTQLSILKKKRLVDAFENINRLNEEAHQLGIGLGNYFAFYILQHHIAVS